VKKQHKTKRDSTEFGKISTKICRCFNDLSDTQHEKSFSQFFRKTNTHGSFLKSVGKWLRLDLQLIGLKFVFLG
jgi:hypothetical protein